MKVLSHLNRLKTNIIIALACWFMLVFEYPAEGSDVPRWWTMLYALAKFGVAFNVAYVVVHEAFPYMRIKENIDKYFAESIRKGKELPDAIALLGMLLFRAIVMSVIIYVICIW